MDKLQLTGQNLGRVSTLDVAVCVYAMQYVNNNKTAYLRVENSVQTTLRVSPTSFCTLCSRFCFINIYSCNFKTYHETFLTKLGFKFGIINRYLLYKTANVRVTTQLLA